jgi:hypothetical protein
MPSYIVKPDPDVDLYVRWSTIVDNVTALGTRAQFDHGYKKDLLNGIDSDWKPERFERADQTGTSAFDGDYGWNDRWIMVHNLSVREDRHSGMLSRENFLKYCTLIYEGKQLEAENLVEPFEDED